MKIDKKKKDNMKDRKKLKVELLELAKKQARKKYIKKLKRVKKKK